MPCHRPLAALAAALALGATDPAAQAQTLTALTHQPPHPVSLPFLLTDGRVMVQGALLTEWFALKPDFTGHYRNGTWTRLASIPAEWNYAPDAFASAVLADGKVLILGGEYNDHDFVLSNQGAIYDPVLDSWTQLAAPPGWANIGDSPSAVLPDGRFVVGRKLDTQMAALDPHTLIWSFLDSTGKNDFNSEEGWTLMPDGTLLTVDVLGAKNSERYLPSDQMWVSDGSTGVDLHAPTTVQGCIPYPGGCYTPPGEVGPQILRPDGSVFAMGASNGGSAHTAVYRPGATPKDPGTWTPGPDFPKDDTGDTAASLLPNGHVLVNSSGGHLYEFDGTTLTQTIDAAGRGILLPLPSGETLFTSSPVMVYRSTGTPDPAWAPVVSAVFSRTLTRGTTNSTKGRLYNGWSQAAAVGDEFQTSTNYPLVRLTNQATGHVVYARTHDHSWMGVAATGRTVHTQFDVPAFTETGATWLQVVANGIASTKVSVTVK